MTTMVSKDEEDRISMAAASARLQRASGVALRAIAIDALGLGVGETLPKGDTYRGQLGVGSGTVQAAFETLARADALTTQSRGRFGRQIVGMRAERLWRLADLEPVRFVLPPRGPLEVRAMAEFSAESMRSRGIAWSIDHRAGASDRIEMLRRGEADVVIVSSGVADQLVPVNDSGFGIIRHAAGTYYAEGRLLVLGAGGRRVAYDPSSHDQSRLTESEFPRAEGWEYVEVEFPRVPVALLRGDADLGVWHEMQTLISPELAGIAVSQPTRQATIETLAASSAAVFLYSRARPELHAAVDSLASEEYARRIAHLTGMPRDSAELFDLGWSA